MWKVESFPLASFPITQNALLTARFAVSPALSWKMVYELRRLISKTAGALQTVLDSEISAGLHIGRRRDISLFLRNDYELIAQ
jgi:hypothetical protein